MIQIFSPAKINLTLDVRPKEPDASFHELETIYHKLNLLTSHQPLDTEIIYPITQSHIDTFSSQNRHLVTETPEVYKSVTKPEIIDGINH